MIKSCVLYKDKDGFTFCGVCGKRYGKSTSLSAVASCKKKQRKPLTIEQQIGQGPGTELKKLIPGFLEHKSCGCKDFAKNMNVWGVEGCKENKQQIVDRLVSESKKRFGLNLIPKIFTTIVAEKMVDDAIKKYEDKLKNGKT